MTDHVDAPSTRPEFVIPVRPAGVPPGLCELRPDIHVVGIEPHGAHYTTAGKLANHIQGTIERQAAGRFYLWEAAQILADSHGKSLEGIRDAMRRAVSLGALCVRVVGSDEPMSVGSRLRIDGMDSYVTPEGLNEWLEAGRYPYRFPVAAAPSASPAVCPEAVAVPAVPEAKEARQARRHQMCIDAGLPMPTDTYAHLPRGVGALARAEGITRQAFAEDVRAHIGRLYGR